jgi:CheY-like chemotaxis protein
MKSRTTISDRMTNQPITVLIVEDNPGDVTLIREMMASASTGPFEIIHAQNLSSALPHLPYGADIVLLDLNLPDSRDLDTLRLIRAYAPAIPIIILTGMSDRRKAVEALAGGAQDYMVKGCVDRHLLTQAILRHLVITD